MFVSTSFHNPHPRPAGLAQWLVVLACCLCCLALLGCEDKATSEDGAEEPAAGSEAAASGAEGQAESNEESGEGVADNSASESDEEPPRSEEPPAPANVDDLTFKMAISSVPTSMDPGLTTDAQSAQIVFNAFEGLMAFDVTSGPVKPAMAETYQVSDQGRTYTFKIRDDARWSNGDPVTAYDFEYAWKRVLDPDTESQYAWLMTDVAHIKNAGEYNRGDKTAEGVGITALDKDTLKVELETPVPHFVDLTAHFTFSPVHRRTLVKHGDNWTKPQHWVSNGPYVLAAQKDQHTYILRKNKEYWDKENVPLERIIVRVIPQDEDRLAAYDAGVIDWTGPSNLPAAVTEKKHLEDELHQDPFLAVEYLVFNLNKEPLDNLAVREALAMAINRDEIVAKALGGVGQPAAGFVPPLPGYRSQVKRRNAPEKARVKLAKAGYPEGQGFPTLTYAYPKGSRSNRAVAELVKDQLKDALGIDIELKEMEYKELLDATNAGDFHIARMGWAGDYIGPSTFLGLWGSNSQQNIAGWKNNQYDSFLQQAASKMDRAERYWLFQQAELLLDKQLPVSPIAHSQQVYVLRSEFGGLEPHVLSVHLMKYVKKY